MPRSLTNSQLKETIASLKRVSRKNKARIWEVLAEELNRSRRSRVAVNLGQIDNIAKASKVIAVPGVVLGGGNTEKNITVGAFRFTDQAREKLEKAGVKCVSLPELAEKHPKGTAIKILK